MALATMIFDDCSCIVWKDRETVSYEEQGRTALVWVDYEAGFFSRGRVIKMDSLEYWSTCQSEKKESISAEKKIEIISKVRRYFSNKPVRTDLE